MYIKYQVEKKLAEKYCSSCIHTVGGECILDEKLAFSCKNSDLMFWFPDLRSKDKIRTITKTIKDSFRISELEAPTTHPKRKIIDDLELSLKHKCSKKCKSCRDYHSISNY